jgi:4-amino-4-deoxy-L-arabinose transferase-like glycosyltransferase
LYRFFSRFVKQYPNPEQAQQAWASYCVVALFIPTLLALLNYVSRAPVKRTLVWVYKAVGSRLFLFIAIAACLIVCRFPILLTNEINPDETLFIAAAQKLFKDPVFFRAVDCGTTGPINVFPLMLPALFGISPDYASTRVIALFIILASIYVIYRAVALLTGDGIARIAILPAAGAFACLKMNDFLHYSSEHVSFLLLSLALYVCVRIFRSPQSHAWSLAGLGLLTAAAFLAKMQTVPMLGCVAMVAIAYVHRSGYAERFWRPSLLFAAGLAPLLLLNAAICAAVGVWHDFWMEYIVANYRYVEAHGALTAELSNFAGFILRVAEIPLLVVNLLAILAAYAYQRMRRGRVSDQALFLQMAVVSGIVAVAADSLLRALGNAIVSYAVLFSILLLPGSFLLLCRDRDRSPAPIRWFGFLAAALLVSAAMAAYTPHRLYGHYLLLFILPLTIAMAWPVVASSTEAEPLDGDQGEHSPGRRAPLPFLLIFATLTLLCQLFQVGAPDSIAFASVPSTVRAPESGLIDAWVQPAGEISVWGWNARPYLGAGRVTSTVDINMSNLFLPRPEITAYYRAAYLRGLQRRPPDLFIDAIDTSHGGFANRQAFGFEVIPEINAFVQVNYIHVLDAYGQRFYMRRDLARGAAAILLQFNASCFFKIVSGLSDKVLEARATSGDNGVAIQQGDYVDGANQQWQLLAVDSTYGKIVSKLSGKVLDVGSGAGATGNGAPIRLGDYQGSANQQWQLVPLGSRGYKIVSKFSGKVLDVRGGPEATGNGVPIQQWDFLGGANQQWQLVPVQ